MKQYYSIFVTGLLSFLLLLILPAIVSWSCEDLSDLEEFVEMLKDPNGGTLFDYYYYCGSGAEEELMIDFEICREQEWIPPEQHSSCIDFVKSREATPTKNKSFYLLWLKSKISEYSNFDIIEIREYENNFRYKLIRTNLGINEVVFYQTIESCNKKEFGTVSITAIDGVPINQMFLIDLNSGYIKRDNN